MEHGGAWEPLQTGDFGPVPFRDFAAAWIDDSRSLFLPVATSNVFALDAPALARRESAELV
jgi:hypothetical protein